MFHQEHGARPLGPKRADDRAQARNFGITESRCRLVEQNERRRVGQGPSQFDHPRRADGKGPGHGLAEPTQPAELDHPIDCDALICGDSVEAKAAVSQLAEMIPGVHAIDAGPLDNARLLESAAALLISLNLRHKIKDSGMRITGVKA